MKRATLAVISVNMVELLSVKLFHTFIFFKSLVLRKELRETGGNSGSSLFHILVHKFKTVSLQLLYGFDIMYKLDN